jgi:acetolactate synthase-1/2/3 large subunit
VNDNTRMDNVQEAETREWVEVPADEVGDAVIAALELGGVEYLFFTSGSEIGFFQEAIAKAKSQGRNKTPRLITVNHEHTSLNAALGYAAVSGKPAITAAHVDVGTQHYGGAVHTAWHSGLPVLITAGAPPTAHPDSMRGARDGGGHIWMQQSFDQHGIVRPYVKWDHRMEYQDNPGLMISRALQVARSEPCGPVYMSFPREISLLKMNGARFPTADQLGIPIPPAPDPDAVAKIAQRLLKARSPAVVVARSGRNPKTMPALVALCELLGLPVLDAALRGYHCFPLNHPLFVGAGSLKDADVVLALEADVPWMPGPDAPRSEAYVAIVDVDAAKVRIPTMEFTANIRLTADSLQTIRALERAARELMSADDRQRIEERTARITADVQAKRRRLEEEARAHSTATPIDPRWLSYQIGQVLDDNCIVFNETIPPNQVHHYLRCARPGSYFYNPGSSGGWSPGAALGAKLAAPERDVVAITGDGFYMFGTANAALWSAAHHGAPFMAVVYQNRSYSTGVLRVASVYPDGYAAKGGYEGGYFDPPIDFAREAEACGAYGENVRDPAEVAPALKRGLEQIRNGRPAVISVWLPRLLQKD